MRNYTCEEHLNSSLSYLSNDIWIGYIIIKGNNLCNKNYVYPLNFLWDLEPFNNMWKWQSSTKWILVDFFSGNLHIMWNLKMPQNLLLQFVWGWTTEWLDYNAYMQFEVNSLYLIHHNSHVYSGTACLQIA